MKYFVFNTVLFFCTLTRIEAQQARNIEEVRSYMIAGRVLNKSMNYGDVKGSPYESDKFNRAAVIFVDGDSIQCFLRYDIYTDEMEFINLNEYDERLSLNELNLQSISNTHSIKLIRLNGQNFYSLNNLVESKMSKGYLIKMNEGTSVLYKKLNVVYKEAIPAKSGYESSIPPTFLRKADDYYIKFNENDLILLNLNKGSIKNYFGAYANELMTFVQENNLNPKKPEDFILVVEYYNNLVLK